MKIQIRRGIFETNSSSTHSITMCTKDDYTKWKNGELIYDSIKEKLISISDEKYQNWKNNKDEEENEEYEDDDYDDKDYMTFDEFFDYCDYCTFESFEEDYISPSGDHIIAFGYYGNSY